MVLAVKGDGNTVLYSFVDLTYLLDTYTGGNTSTAKVTVDGKEITVAVNVSKEADNALQVKEDGLYVPKAEVVDISGKADKVANATEGNFAGLDANGNLTDSGKKASDFVAAEAKKRLMTDEEVPSWAASPRVPPRLRLPRPTATSRSTVRSRPSILCPRPFSMRTTSATTPPRRSRRCWQTTRANPTAEGGKPLWQVSKLFWAGALPLSANISRASGLP